jgi:hypothetical protein
LELDWVTDADGRQILIILLINETKRRDRRSSFWISYPTHASACPHKGRRCQNGLQIIHCGSRGTIACGQGCLLQEDKTMLKFSITVIVAGAGIFAASSVNAANISTVYAGPNDSLIEQVRTVCDDRGRCYRTHGGRRVIVEDSYNYAPRERYYGQRTYREYDAPRAGIGIDAPGVSVGVGTGRW